MFYRINKFKDVESFTAAIAEHMKYEKKVDVEPLADTRKELFEKIVDKTFELEGLISAIRDMGNLHMEGTVPDYDHNSYLELCGLINNLSNEISILADATDQDITEDYIRPLEERAGAR